MKSIRYGIFGGSFDPPHLGHAMVCLSALESGQVDRVMMIPVGGHAFGKKTVATFDQRMEMCKIATQIFGDRLLVSDIEGNRTGTSYMVDTLEILSKENSTAKFRLIVGSDVAAEVKLWKNADRVLELAPLLEVPRLLKGEKPDQRVGCLPNISSTIIRESLRTGKQLDYLISHSVRQYIEKHKLYIPETQEPPQ